MTITSSPQLITPPDISQRTVLLTNRSSAPIYISVSEDVTPGNGELIPPKSSIRRMVPAFAALFAVSAVLTELHVDAAGGDSMMFYPTGRDRAAIQAALDAAEEAGGGIVQLGYGIYTILTVNSPAAGFKAGGAIGLEIPSGVTLQGMGDGTVLSIVADGAYGVGTGISPKGMQTAVGGADGFGIAATDVTLRNFKIWAPVQEDSAGILVSLGHADRWLLENIHFAGCLHHALEFDQCRNIEVKRCRTSGSYTGISGCPIQCDYGLAGAINRPPSITWRTIQDVLFVDCTIDGLCAAPRLVELAHNEDQMEIRRLTFLRCTFFGNNAEFTSCVDIAGANTGGFVERLLFDRCLFITRHVKASAFAMNQVAGRTFNGIHFHDCEFRGPSAVFVYMGGSTSPTYNATHSLRWGGEIKRCKFFFDASQMVAGLDINLVIANAWSSFTLEDCDFEATGAFPVSVGQNYCRVALINNNKITRVNRNTVNWKATGTFSVTASGFIVDISLLNQAGGALAYHVNENALYTTGSTWSYGCFFLTGTVARPIAFTCSGNYSNFATTPTNNIVATGANIGISTITGGLGAVAKEVTGNYTLTEFDFIVDCNTAGGSITITPAPVIGRRAYIIVKRGASNTLTCNGVSITEDGDAIVVYSDGAATRTIIL